MSQAVPVAEATIGEAVLREWVQEVLGELVGTAKEGLVALSVEVGLGVLRELLEEEVEELVGPRGRWNRDRTAVRHGRETGEVTLGGWRVGVKRPRVRTADGESELPLVTYEHFADRDPLESAGGDHARRDRAARVHLHRRAGDHDRGREAGAGAVGGLERERDRRRRAAVGSGRPGRGGRAGTVVRDRRIEGAVNAVANFEFERLIGRPPTPRRRNRS